ncbi:MAG: hypothetical protein QM706_16505 [Nitrospira sp.]
MKNYHKTVGPGETHKFTFVAKKPGVFFYPLRCEPNDPARRPRHVRCHHRRSQERQRLAQSRSGIRPRAIRAVAKPGYVQAMFDRKFDFTIFNGGVFKHHPFMPGGEPLEVKVGERVRIYFVNAGPNEFSALHPIAEIWDNVYESGNPANKFTGVQTYVVGPGSAATFDMIADEPGAYPVVTHSFTSALRGAIAVIVANQNPKDYKGQLMPNTPWNP